MDTYLYKFIELGGNTRFKDFCATNEITDTTDFEVKYKCAAVDYYRRNLKCKVLNLGELQKDFTVDGLLERYDDQSPYMFGEVLNGREETLNKFR